MIDQLANAGAEPIAIEQVAPTTQPEADTTQEAATTDEANKAESNELPIPKKILNAMSHKDRRIGKLTAKQYEAEAKIKQLEEQLATYNKPKESQQSGKPNTANFDNYEDYLQALAEYQVGEKFSESEKKRQQFEAQKNQSVYHEERIAKLEENDQAAKASFSDYDNVFSENEALAADMPEHVKQAFLEAEHPAYAFYAIAKEGKLEDMLNMSERQAIAMIARYEDKGLAMSKAKQVTKAPAPMSPAKGTSAGSKSLDAMSGDELLKWIRTK